MASHAVDLIHLLTLRRAKPWVQNRAAFVTAYPLLRALQIMEGRSGSGGEWVGRWKRVIPDGPER